MDWRGCVRRLLAMLSRPCRHTRHLRRLPRNCIHRFGTRCRSEPENSVPVSCPLGGEGSVSPHVQRTGDLAGSREQHKRQTASRRPFLPGTVTARTASGAQAVLGRVSHLSQPTGSARKTKVISLNEPVTKSVGSFRRRGL